MIFGGANISPVRVLFEFDCILHKLGAPLENELHIGDHRA